MKRRTKKIIGVVVVVGAVAAGGAAYTAASSIPNTVAGFASGDITGANATSIQYNLNAAKDNIDSETLVFTEDLTGDTVEAAFNHSTTFTPCTVDLVTDPAGHTVQCVISQDPDTATSFQVSVTNANKT